MLFILGDAIVDSISVFHIAEADLTGCFPHATMPTIIKVN